jgi:hypothetical protein
MNVAHENAHASSPGEVADHVFIPPPTNLATTAVAELQELIATNGGGKNHGQGLNLLQELDAKVEVDIADAAEYMG